MSLLLIMPMQIYFDSSQEMKKHLSHSFLSLPFQKVNGVNLHVSTAGENCKNNSESSFTLKLNAWWWAPSWKSSELNEILVQSPHFLLGTMQFMHFYLCSGACSSHNWPAERTDNKLFIFYTTPRNPKERKEFNPQPFRRNALREYTKEQFSY